MNKRGSFWGVFFILLLLVGAVFAWLYYKDFEPLKTPTNKTASNITNITEKVCKVCDFPDLDKVAYYFDNETYKGLNIFMDNSKNYLYCSFTSLESNDYANRFIALKNAGIDVRMHFGIEDTMDSCEVTCVPKLTSQYNHLLGEGVDVSYSRIHFNFCVNEKAIYIFSLLPETISGNDNGLIIFDTQLRDKYETYFKEISS